MSKKLIITSTAVLALLALLASPAAAQTEAAFGEAADAQTVQNNLDVLYFMVCAGLVFWMQAGFAMVETGMTRSKNAANIMMKNITDATLGITIYFLFGWALMYGADAGGFIGTDMFALTAGNGEYAATGVNEGNGFLAIDFMFQAVFAATAATIVSGAVAGRIKFTGYLVITFMMTGIIYPIVGHWKWGGGWLDAMGFYDFAGSTLVHMTGGVAALVLAGILGPRLGKYGADGRARAIPGHSMPLATLGMFILWLGWFGFNGGSVLTADGNILGLVILTTVLAACGGGFTAMFFTWGRYGKPDIGMTINGVLGGLVGITAGADSVGALEALLIGIIAGVVVAVTVPAIDALKIDDAVGAFSVHGAAGAWGTIAVGLFDSDAGIFYGGGADLLIDQIVGVVAVAAFVAVCAAILGFGLKAANLLRVDENEEIEGLDIHEHGMYGYPEAALGATAYPGGPVTAPTGETVAG